MPFDSSCNEGQLYTDSAPHGQRSFHTTLQLVTKQGCRSLPVKVDPGTDINTIPLSCYKTLFPKYFTKDGHLKQNALRSTASTWTPHVGCTKQFLGYFMIDTQHKTSPHIKPLSSYIFKDTPRPFTLLSYPTLIHLGIVEFKAPNEASKHAMVNSITNTPNSKQVLFNNPLHSSNPVKKTPAAMSPKKSLLKCRQHCNKPFQDHHNTLQDHAPKTTTLPIVNNASQDHVTEVTPPPIGNSALQDHVPKVTPQPIENN